MGHLTLKPAQCSWEEGIRKHFDFCYIIHFNFQSYHPPETETASKKMQSAP